MDIDNDKPEFTRMLKKAMGAYSKPLPEKSLIDVWVEILQTYPLRVIGMAFRQYIDENSDFEPKPAGIAKLCKLMDGRPGAEEAWAISLTSQDEADTVVWTQEMAEAFNLCKPILDKGDEVGARMAFKESYQRLVTDARLSNRAAQWSASIGWDVQKRSAALKKASVAGLLSAPSVSALLPPPMVKSETLDENARAQLQKVKEMLANSQNERDNAHELAAQEERDRISARKKQLNDQAKGLRHE